MQASYFVFSDGKISQVLTVQGVNESFTDELFELCQNEVNQRTCRFLNGDYFLNVQNGPPVYLVSKDLNNFLLPLAGKTLCIWFS